MKFSQFLCKRSILPHKSFKFLKRLSFKIKSEGLLPFAVRIFASKTFLFFEKYFSLHLTPAHFYSPIPTLSQLDSQVYTKIFSANGINIDVDNCLENMSHIADEYLSEYTPQKGFGLSPVDSFVLYASVRHFRFPVVVEIGAGDTTHIILKALDKNSREGYPSKLLSIEPFPRDDVINIESKNFELIISKFEDTDPSLLVEADFIFIDSSHVSKINSDVNCQILELLPMVKKQAVIHWHDIVFPRNYWKDWMHNGNQFWNESYLLHAFMLFNDSFSILWPSQFMQTHHPDSLKKIFPFYLDTHRLTSFWIQRLK